MRDPKSIDPSCSGSSSETNVSADDNHRLGLDLDLEGISDNVISDNVKYSSDGDGDEQIPTYLLMDEDDYESIVAQFRHSSFGVEIPVISRAPSRPMTPCRQTKLKELLGQIDGWFPETSSRFLGHGVVRYKHLMEMIEESGCLRGCPVEEREQLITAVLGQSSSASKWASPGRIGQAELYEALEKVLNELKSFTPYSLPFCAKVNKKEVPDYFDVIKRPMDLGTMARKLKSMLYTNKREFTADLQRIHNNCYTYNTDPNSVLRMHVTMLREKWTRLMAEVPDIQIRVGTLTGLEERTLSNLSAETADQTISEQSLSSRNPTTSQIIESQTGIEAHISIERPQSPIGLLDSRTPHGMGFYHRSRTRPSARPSSHRHPSHFRPELSCPMQIIPDPLSLQRTVPDPAPFDGSRIDRLLENLEYWRKLWSTRLDRLDHVVQPKITFQVPLFASDAKVLGDRETKKVLALLLANEGFQTAKSDAMTLLMDLFIDKFSSLATNLNDSFSTNHLAKPNLTLIRHSLHLDTKTLTTYTQTFLSHRRKCLERAVEAVEEASRHRTTDEDVDIEAVDDQQDLGEDDLLDVDDESLLLGDDELLDSQPPPPPPHPPTINLTSITATDILMVPKRTLQIPMHQPPKRPRED